MSELTREEKIDAEIKEAKIDKAKVETFLAEAIKVKDKKNTDKLYDRLSTVDVRTNMLLEHLESERQLQRSIATESKVLILVNLLFYLVSLLLLL